MKKKALLVALSVLLLSAMLFPSICQAGPTDVVVQVGDWFKYEARVTKWISTDPFLPEGFFGPLSLADNETTSIVYTVTAITPVTEPAVGTNVTFSITYNWKDGSVTTGTLEEHVSTASQDIFMIGANMEAGQMVSDTWLFFGMVEYPARYITDTIDFVNPITTRATNELNYSINLFGNDYNYTMWWDEATGIRIYYENWGNVVNPYMTAPYEYTVVYKLVDSSVASLLYIPEVFTTIVMLVILSASTASIVLYRRKKLLI